MEVIPDGESFLDWLTASGLLDSLDSAGVERLRREKGLDDAAAAARALRAWAQKWIERWRNRPKDNFAPDLRRLNALLARSDTYREAVQGKGVIELFERTDLSRAEALVPLLALQLAKLVTEEDPELVKRCAGANCTLWFLDRTKAHRRMYCSAAVCGNRAKVAAFRDRQRQSR